MSVRSNKPYTDELDNLNLTRYLADKYAQFLNLSRN